VKHTAEEFNWKCSANEVYNHLKFHYKNYGSPQARVQYFHTCNIIVQMSATRYTASAPPRSHSRFPLAFLEVEYDWPLITKPFSVLWRKLFAFLFHDYTTAYTQIDHGRAI